MSVFYVFQGDTYEKEKNGSYVWSPQLDIKGRKNNGYTNMTKIQKGDFILHHKKPSKLVAISIAQTGCMEADKPRELAEGKDLNRWNKEGYKVDLIYYEFDTPLDILDFSKWLENHHEKNSAFNVNGKGNQKYMCTLAETHAIFLLNEAIKVQQNLETLNQLNIALAEIVGETDSEYDQVELDLINIGVDDDQSTSSTERLVVEKKEQEVTFSTATGREIPKRNTKIAIEALKGAGFKCEVDPNHQTFLRKNGTPYTEPHHLIPISKYKDFPYSLDVQSNIVSLCSNCHNLLHYGRMEEKQVILLKLHNNRKKELAKQGIELDLNSLKKYY